MSNNVKVIFSEAKLYESSRILSRNILSYTIKERILNYSNKLYYLKKFKFDI